MTAFTNSYRSKAILSVFLICAKSLIAETKPAAGAAPEPAPQPASSIVLKQVQSGSKMTASVDAQKAAIQKQIGLMTASDSFFSISWSTPATIPLPHLIASCSAMPEADLKALVEENAKKQQVKAELIRAVIRRESGSFPCAVSDRGALGLMQLMPDVADQFGADALDAAQNVRVGSQYLKQLLTRYKGDVKLALAAYNAGPQRVDANHKVPDIAETVAYVDSIMKDLSATGASRR